MNLHDTIETAVTREPVDGQALLSRLRVAQPHPSRRRAALAVALAGTAVLGSIGAGLLLNDGSRAPGPAGGPVQAVSSSNLRPIVRDAELTRAASFDGGKLLLEPPADATLELSEAEAVALARSRFLPGSESVVRNVVVTRARATLNTPVDSTDQVIRPTQPVEMVGTEVWVIAYENHAPRSCRRMGSQPVVIGGEPAQVFLVAADGSGIGVMYEGAGVVCGRAMEPNARPAIYSLAVDFTFELIGAGRARLTAALPQCATLSGATGSPSMGYALGAEIALVGGACVTEDRRWTLDVDANDRTPVAPMAVGLARTLVTGEGGAFDAYNGR